MPTVIAPASRAPGAGGIDLPAVPLVPNPQVMMNDPSMQAWESAMTQQVSNVVNQGLQAFQFSMGQQLDRMTSWFENEFARRTEVEELRNQVSFLAERVEEFHHAGGSIRQPRQLAGNGRVMRKATTMTDADADDGDYFSPVPMLPRQRQKHAYPRGQYE